LTSWCGKLEVDCKDAGKRTPQLSPLVPLENDKTTSAVVCYAGVAGLAGGDGSGVCGNQTRRNQKKALSPLSARVEW